MFRLILILFLAGLFPQLQAADEMGTGTRLHHEQFEVEGAMRDAFVYVPASARRTPAPVVFVFHGHGGTAETAAAQFHMSQHWPEAISVYMQGLKTFSPRDKKSEQPGWQTVAGEYQDRDLKFFDAVLARLIGRLKVDKKHVYATGQSDGGRFTYLLWSARGDSLAAVAPSEAPRAQTFLSKLHPKPVLNIAGEKDTLVPLEKQKEVIEALRKLNGCGTSGRKWGRYGTLYASVSGTPVITFIHPGGHELPDFVPGAITRFFQMNLRGDEP
jgi:polyhydroxybutyrate depolymerase